MMKHSPNDVIREKFMLSVENNPWESLCNMQSGIFPHAKTISNKIII